MAAAKTTTLTFRIEPALKEALRTTAQCEHRSIANMAGVLIREYCGRNGIGILEQGSPMEESKKQGKPEWNLFQPFHLAQPSWTVLPILS